MTLEPGPKNCGVQNKHANQPSEHSGSTWEQVASEQYKSRMCLGRGLCFTQEQRGLFLPEEGGPSWMSAYKKVIPDEFVE